LVDGQSNAQVTNGERISTVSGHNIATSIEYIHVSCVLTEDCPTLLGYDLLTSKFKISPISDRAVLRLWKESTGQSLVVGARSASAALNHFLRNPGKLRGQLSDVTGGFDSSLILDSLQADLFRLEKNKLEQLQAFKLISRRAFYLTAK